jgi:acylglycerol lipase
VEHQVDLAGAIVIGSALGRGSGVSRLKYCMASFLSAAAPLCPLIRLRAPDLTQDAEVARAYDADPLVHHGPLDARTIGEMATVIKHLPEQFPRLRLPLLLLHGAADITASPDGSRGLLDGARSPDKTLALYEGRRHDVLNEPGHEQVMTDIVTWLDAHR